ncbi:transposable element Tcb2 transposase [Trichonephila clavipes]|nr:transposable element Tcb2 transposase [Trichonephila clavipes]
MTAQRYDILQPHVLPLIKRLPGALFQQDNARPHTARVSKDCFRTVTSLPWPGRFHDLSPIEHIWDHLRRTCMPQCPIVSHRAFVLEEVQQDPGPRNSSWQGTRCTPVVSRSLERQYVLAQSPSPNFEGEYPGVSGVSHLSFYSNSTNLTRGLEARRLFTVPQCRKGTIHLQTPEPSPGFESRSYSTTVRVANYYT